MIGDENTNSRRKVGFIRKTLRKIRQKWSNYRKSRRKVPVCIIADKSLYGKFLRLKQRFYAKKTRIIRRSSRALKHFWTLSIKKIFEKFIEKIKHLSDYCKDQIKKLLKKILSQIEPRSLQYFFLMMLLSSLMIFYYWYLIFILKNFLNYININRGFFDPKFPHVLFFDDMLLGQSLSTRVRYQCCKFQNLIFHAPGQKRDALNKSLLTSSWIGYQIDKSKQQCQLPLTKVKENISNNISNIKTKPKTWMRKFAYAFLLYRFGVLTYKVLYYSYEKSSLEKRRSEFLTLRRVIWKLTEFYRTRSLPGIIKL